MPPQQLGEDIEVPFISIDLVSSQPGTGLTAPPEGSENQGGDGGLKRGGGSGGIPGAVMQTP